MRIVRRTALATGLLAVGLLLSGVVAAPAAIAAPGAAVDPDPYHTEQGRITRLDFDSPNRNLHCGIVATGDSDSFYGCTIEKRTYKEPPRRGCPLAFGKGFVAPFAGKPQAACRGDVLFRGEERKVKVLRSGKSVSLGAITCKVKGNTVTCGNQRGDGFTLSKTAYRLRG
jgi:hypothetical protein